MLVEGPFPMEFSADSETLKFLFGTFSIVYESLNEHTVINSPSAVPLCVKVYWSIGAMYISTLGSFIYNM